ncbi:MAG: SDR family NAD(P)-dependent oxidoreductase, partial [Deltaproteobacteria bacterium]|nr:SDR family NAD(P)-dependent oxidoreductase [Deltaproteobacteria bacterium]
MAKTFNNDPMKLRIYSTQLLGREPGLVLHGGGNTSVKIETENFFGDREEILYVKGSGRNLETIDAEGFSPVKLDVLRRMISLDRVSDGDMVRIQRTAMSHPSAPNPSIEAILHAIIPFKYVDHTHADAVVTITNNPNGKTLLRDIYKDRVLIVPYVKPGFELGKTVYERVQSADWDKLDGMIIMHHGVFTFADDARTSYDRMIHLASLAEAYLQQQGALSVISQAEAGEDLLALSRIRRLVSMEKGSALLAGLDKSSEACGFADLPDLMSIATRGPITSDHLIHTKPFPIIFGKDMKQDVADYVSAYNAYFDRNTDRRQTALDPAPKWGIWPEYGTIAFGRNVKEINIISDIVCHTIRAIQWGEAIGGWKPISEKEMFDMEYWELQQAKLHEKEISPELQGKIALITGAASGIGRACTEMLHEQGAVVVGLDVNPEITRMFNLEDMVGVHCDITDAGAVKDAVEMIVRRFGGLDILVLNAGIFPPVQKIEDVDEKIWEQSMDINLTSQQRLLKTCIPFLKQGIDAAVVFISSKNVPAPGPGASAYSVPKAGQTQLARIAAMELGPDNIRVNIVHPD